MESINKPGMLILFYLLAGDFQQVKSQGFSFSDLFGQAGKQKQYYMQQIAAYNAFESELKQGYGVIKHGLNGVASINTAELNAHSAYYTALKQPSQQVKNNKQIQDITQWQLAIISRVNSLSRVNGLTSGEQSYVTGVRAGILKNCSSDLTDLQNLIATGTLQMTDDQRLRQLTKIHQNMQEKYEFTQTFCNTVRMLVIQRQQGTNDTQTLKELYGTH